MSEKKEYIERSALIRALDDHKSKVNWDILETHTNTLIAFVIQEPAATVEPVVRGEWKEGYISGLKVSDGAICSKCDCWSARESSFCPDCGAHMEGSGSGELFINV